MTTQAEIASTKSKIRSTKQFSKTKNSNVAAINVKRILDFNTFVFVSDFVFRALDFELPSSSTPTPSSPPVATAAVGIARPRGHVSVDEQVHGFFPRGDFSVRR